MKPSQRLYDFLKKEESIELTAYRDSVGIWTVGVGTIQYENGEHVKKGDKITLERAMELLAYEVTKKTEGINRALGGIVLNQNQFDSLCSITYNIGLGGLASSTLLKRIKANPCDPTIRDAFAMWNKITIDGKLVPSKGLTLRRKREADLYFSIT